MLYVVDEDWAKQNFPEQVFRQRLYRKLQTVQLVMYVVTERDLN